MLDKDLIVFDVETTGNNPKTCSIIQIGAIRVSKEGRVVMEDPALDMYVKPYTETWEEDAFKVHGLEKDFLERVGIDITRALAYFEGFCGNLDKVYLAQWSCGWDMECLKWAYKRIEKDYPFNYRGYDIASFVRLFLAGMGHLPSKKQGLTRCCNAVNMKMIGNAHNAKYDAINTAKLLEKMLQRARGFRLLEEGYIK